jgi:glyoxylase-like metal-dependent hydrolase (beta-lactamase superfamily II)
MKTSINTISAGTFKLDGGAMHGVVPKTIWEQFHPADAKNLCTWDTRCLLYELGEQLLLIDTGLGHKQPEKWQSYYEPEKGAILEDNLLKLGFTFDHITDVLLSHLHFDHAGGAISLNQNNKAIPTFKNAKYWTHSQHWAWAYDPNPKEKATFLKENLMPLLELNLVHFVDQQPFPYPNIELLTTSGHTEKMLLPLISFQDKKILFAADTIPSHKHVHVPFVMAYDNNPLQTINDKISILEKAVTNDWILVYDHDIHVEASKIAKNDKGFYAIECGDLKQFMQ